MLHPSPRNCQKYLQFITFYEMLIIYSLNYSELANDFGNLAQRVLSFVGKNCDSTIPTPGVFTAEDDALLAAAADSLQLARGCVDTQNLKGMCEVIINVAKLGNKYIDVQAPWALKKTDEARMRTVLYVLAETLRITAVLLLPVMESSCTNMLDQIGMLIIIFRQIAYPALHYIPTFKEVSF
jgi:methionyl-tRNA synthetase